MSRPLELESVMKEIRKKFKKKHPDNGDIRTAEQQPSGGGDFDDVVFLCEVKISVS